MEVGEKGSKKLAKILVAIDGSEASDYALNIAIKIGEKFSSRVDILHIHTSSSGTIVAPVFDPILGSSTMVIPPPTSIAEGEPKKSDAKVKGLLSDRKALVVSRNLECEAITVRSDDVSGEILKFAIPNQYDLIVMGSRGATGLKSLLLGSVSTKIAKEAKTSVLIMKKKIDSGPKMLLGYDGSEESKIALELAGEIGKKFSAQVDPLSVVGIPISPEGYMVSGVEKWEKEMKGYVEEAVSFLKLHEVKSEGRVVDFVDISKGLVEEAERGGYDIIVVGNRGQGRLKTLFLGSVASGVANSAKTNVLIARSTITRTP